MRKRRKSREQKDVEAATVLLCLDYFATILPEEQLAEVGLILLKLVSKGRTREARLERVEDLVSRNLALVLERLKTGDRLKLNARIIQKLDNHPISGIANVDFKKAL